MTVIAVIDYDMGNIHSACKGLEKAGAIPNVTDNLDEIWAADGVVLPGVGAFDPGIQHLRKRDLISPIRDLVASGKLFLGICVGLQVLFESSEEGIEPGLGVVQGTIERFRPEPGITIPHMGWNQLEITQPDIPLFSGVKDGDWLYFVHSYYANPTDSAVTAATVTHGSQTITAAIAQNNLMAVQFHPEKSAHVGLKILSNFVELVEAKQPALSTS
ncbi:MAG: imidazole glycerol phosphate synthase subunit HisH [Cyanobacteria bacterium P01_D01_bin.128]